AMPGILRHYPGASLLLVSGINHAERAEVERLGAELGVSQNIEFLGRVDDATLINLFRACDAYLTPTRYEGFGLTLLEAMAAQAPVVSSRIPVVDEIVRDGENGLLAAYDDAEALAAATLRILDDPALAAALRANGLRTCEVWYNPDRLTAQLEAVYRHVIDRK
ncbi:MAG TPA: glycosyltransferase family 4 protein, partial [Herpetosiphonaceae bacterium]|nr:glycosyltransferase family 4 protein [Herpetosiphonaceae bacterium]